jgi:putative flavoprotein involved in K+ transport
VTDVGVLDVAVVGGGQAGLAMGWHLRERGLSCTIMEAGPAIGQSWRSRWDSLRLFTPARYAGLPGLPFPGPPDAYPGKDQVADYLVEYAAAFDLPVRVDTAVTRLRKAADVFTLTTSAGLLQARQVVVATGPFQTPSVPPVAAELSADVVQLHSSAYRNPDQLPTGDVVVVGAGNSGFQIAAELATHREVVLSIGACNAAIPQRPLGRDIFWWQTAFGLVTAPIDSRRGRWMRRGEGTVIGTTTRQLRDAGVTLRSRLVGVEDHRVRFSDGHAVAGLSTVVWATGYRRDHSWVDLPDAVDERGRLRHDGGITPVPGLFVLGEPWQRTSGSALIGYVGHDAAHLATLIR